MSTVPPKATAVHNMRSNHCAIPTDYCIRRSRARLRVEGGLLPPALSLLLQRAHALVRFTKDRRLCPEKDITLWLWSTLFVNLGLRSYVTMPPLMAIYDCHQYEVLTPEGGGSTQCLIFARGVATTHTVYAITRWLHKALARWMSYAHPPAR